MRTRGRHGVEWRRGWATRTLRAICMREGYAAARSMPLYGRRPQSLRARRGSMIVQGISSRRASSGIRRAAHCLSRGLTLRCIKGRHAAPPISLPTRRRLTAVPVRCTMYRRYYISSLDGHGMRGRRLMRAFTSPRPMRRYTGCLERCRMSRGRSRPHGPPSRRGYASIRATLSSITPTRALRAGSRTGAR